MLVEFGRSIDPEINAKIRDVAYALRKTAPKGIVELIPAYHSLLLIYDPSVIRPTRLISITGESLSRCKETDTAISGRRVEIPVCYDKEFGPDIQDIGSPDPLDIPDMIKLHSGPEYLIYMVGFTPGFPFLGGLNKALFTPRLKTPRSLVPEGSVGIANDQTGIYPVASPGGWRIIGRTPLQLFAPRRKSPFLYQAGDTIQFVPISRQEYDRLEKKERER